MRGFAAILLFVVATNAYAAGQRRVPSVNFTAANEAFVQGDYARAVALYTALLARKGLSSSDKETIYLNRGYSYLNLQRPSEATADLHQALILHPKDEEAAAGLSSINNHAAGAPDAADADSATAWGPLARLPGKYWVEATVKPVLYLRFEWARVGISMLFAGKDLNGNRIEGQYFLDPATRTLRATTAYRGKTKVTDLSAVATEVTETGDKRQRQVMQLDRDGTFNILDQKPNGKIWKTMSISTFTPTSSQVIASLGWPDQEPERHSFLKEIGASLKGGALEGFHDGMRDGVHDAVQDRVRRITGTRMCSDVSGQAVACPN